MTQAPSWLDNWFSANFPHNTNLHSNGGTGFQPVHAQAEACGYQKLPYDCDLV
jgi:hypothetical protein